MSSSPRASDVFASPPRGNELQKINQFYDTVVECVNHLEQKMDENYSSCKKALADVREAIDDRRSMAIRGEVHEKMYDVNVVSSAGELRWAWYTDGSSGSIDQGNTIRYGVGARLQNVKHFTQRKFSKLNFTQRKMCKLQQI